MTDKSTIQEGCIFTTNSRILFNKYVLFFVFLNDEFVGEGLLLTNFRNNAFYFEKGKKRVKLK